MQITQTQENWRTLKKIALTHFSCVHVEKPHWTVEQLFEANSLPVTALLCELAVEAGFEHEIERTTVEDCEVLAGQTNIVHASEEVISSNVGIGLKKVQGILKSRSAGYGHTPFGCTAYGGNRALSDGKSAVARRTTVNGQLSYRGHRYSLGALYRGRMVFVIERERELLITCNDRSPLHVTRYRSG